MDKPVDCYQFGPFRLYPEKKVLLREDHEVSLTPKVFEILVVLIENRDRVLPKTEMMELIWPDSYVDEANLTQHISVLRRILGGAAKESKYKYIVTAPGYGYRFRKETLFENTNIIVQEKRTTEVVFEETFEEETVHPPQTEPAKPVTSVKVEWYHRIFYKGVRRWYLVSVAAMLSLIGTAWWFASGGSGVRHPIRPGGSGGRQSTRPGGFPTTELVDWKSESSEDYGDASISPDNWKIAYSVVRDGRRCLYYKQLDEHSRENKLTEGNWNEHGPIWSPNGQEIAFISDRGGKVAVWRMPATGGTAVHIWDVSDVSNPSLRHWSKDGGTIYLEADLNLFALDINTGDIKPVTSLAKNGMAGRYFSISATEDNLVYLDKTESEYTILVGPIGGAPKRVLTQPEEIRGLVWHPDGKRIIYNAKLDGYYQVAVLDISSGKIDQLTFDKTDHFLLDVSINGSRILYDSTKEESSIWSVGLDTASESEFISDISFKFWPAVSLDSDQIVFQSIRNMSLSISMAGCSIETRSIANRTETRSKIEDGISPELSPDGKSIAFLRSRAGKWNLWVAAADGGRPRVLTSRGVYTAGSTQLPYNRWQTAYFMWSKDSSSLIYATSDKNKAGIWQVAVNGSGETNIVEKEASDTKPYLRLYCPSWSSDGRYLGWISHEQSLSGEDKTWALWITDLLTRESRLVSQFQSPVRVLGWSNAGDKLIVVNRIGDRGRITTTTDCLVAEIDVATGNVQRKQTLESTYFYNMQLSADGRMLAFDSRIDGRDELYVVPVFVNKLQKLTTNTDPFNYFSTLVWSPDCKRIFFSKQKKWNIISAIDQFE